MYCGRICRCREKDKATKRNVLRFLYIFGVKRTVNSDGSGFVIFFVRFRILLCMFSLYHPVSEASLSHLSLPSLDPETWRLRCETPNRHATGRLGLYHPVSGENLGAGLHLSRPTIVKLIPFLFCTIGAFVAYNLNLIADQLQWAFWYATNYGWQLARKGMELSN